MSESYPVELSPKERTIIAQCIADEVQEKNKQREAQQYGGYCTERFNNEIEELSQIYGKLMQTKPMIAGHIPKFSVGDMVVVCNDSLIYQGYFEWFDDADESISGHYDEEGFTTNGVSAEVVRVAAHTQYPEFPLLYGIRVGTDIFIIEESGITKKEK